MEIAHATRRNLYDVTRFLIKVGANRQVQQSQFTFKRIISGIDRIPMVVMSYIHTRNGRMIAVPRYREETYVRCHDEVSNERVESVYIDSELRT